jgi:hypothetical protein
MVDETVSYTATDICDPSPTCSLAVASDEPVNGVGDGNTAPDWIVLDAHHLQLRRERAGGGDGRTYTIIVTCGDDDGNVSTEHIQVTVPHDRSN